MMHAVAENLEQHTYEELSFHIYIYIYIYINKRFLIFDIIFFIYKFTVIVGGENLSVLLGSQWKS